MKNVVVFNTADELEEKIKYIKLHNLYPELQKNSLEWARNNSCKQVAKRIIDQVQA
jgi:transcription termination factor Rho